MRLLLDTQALVWWLQHSRRLSRGAYEAIGDSANAVWVSAVTPWEIEIKRGRPGFMIPRDVVRQIGRAGFAPLPISLEHGVAAGRLPRHHGDPFDRMLVAQAQLEGLTIVTNDEKIADYQVAVLPV